MFDSVLHGAILDQIAMTVTLQQRVRISPDVWALVEAAARVRRISPSSILEEALRSYFGPRQDLAEAARIVTDMQCERAAVMEKIDLLFLATAGSERAEL